MDKRVDVGLVLWNADIIHLMSLAVRDRNLTSCGIEPVEGPERVEDLIVSFGPTVVVYDLEPPYARSTAVALRIMERFPDQSFVMTSADPRLAFKSAPSLAARPMFQKPYDIDEIVDTVSSIVAHAAMERTIVHHTIAASERSSACCYAARRMLPPPAVRPTIRR